MSEYCQIYTRQGRISCNALMLQYAILCTYALKWLDLEKGGYEYPFWEPEKAKRPLRAIGCALDACIGLVDSLSLGFAPLNHGK